MGIKLLLSTVILCFSSAAFATVRDSVGVENMGGKKLILHKVDPKDSYYSIGRRYNVNPKALMDFNTNKALKPGDVVKVKTDLPFIQEKKVAVSTTNPVKNSTAASPAGNSAKGTSSSQQTEIEHTVGPKETLYSISRRYNITVDEIKNLNNLRANGLAIGQILKIRYGQPNSNVQPAQPVVQAPVITQRADSNEVDSITDASSRLRLPPQRYGLREVVERGVASYIIDKDLDNSKMLALHPTAPPGTIIKITNPMTNKTTFAKVVGRFTDNEATKDAIIVVNKATADLIGALDKRFQVTLVYGVPNE